MNPAPIFPLVRFRAGAFRSLAAVLALFWSADALCAEPEKVEVPIISMDETVQRELNKLNQVLDVNPKLETELSANVDRLTESMFRAQNPEIDALLKRQPNLPKALKAEQHFFVHRQLARLAKARVTRKDAVALDNFLKEHPEISKAVRKNPRQIVNSDFLIANPALARFLETHPGLSSVLLKRSDKKAPSKK